MQKNTEDAETGVWLSGGERRGLSSLNGYT